MQLGAVALVLAETIFGKTRAKFTHNPIARDLGDDAGGRDGETIAIAFDDGGLGQREGRNGKPIDENVFRRKGERRERRAHGAVGRTQNVDPVDLDVIDNADGPRDFAVADKIDINFFAKFGRELFGVVQFPVTKFLGKNHGRGHDRSGERAAPGFIDSGNANDTDGA